MKKRKWLQRNRLLFIMAAVTTLLFGSCSDWGKMDPPAGNQIYPNLEKVGSYTFDDGIDPAFQLTAYPGGNLPALESDEEHGGVLHLNGGYAQLGNPLNKVKVQAGVSLTFWFKQPAPEEGATQDLKGAIFSFENEDGSQRMFFTANGWLSYTGADGTYESNNPSTAQTGIMTPGEWHYVAMAVTNTGYFIAIDGTKVIDQTVTDFDCSKIVQFMASAPLLYIGYGSGTQSGEMWIDDFTVYRNIITDTQIQVPTAGGGETNSYIIVGEEDLSTPWWTAFSDLITMTGNQSMHYGFYNYSSEAANWDNWVLVVTNGKKYGDAGYAEYFVLRSDAYGWGDGNYDATNITSNYNWDTFTSDMNGAYVDLTITRTDNHIDVTAVTTTKGGLTYKMTFSYDGTLVGTIGSFLTCEKSYLEIDPQTVFVGQSYAPGSYLVGPADLSAPWWAYFSDYTTITGNTSYPFVYTFINNTSGLDNWDNWVMAVTNNKNRGDDGYAEYFVVRADAYGWGDTNYNAANISASYDWGTFKQQMNGAACMIILTRNGNRIDMTAKVTTANGEKLGDYTFFYEGVTTPDVGLFLLVEKASLDM